jgi:RHS repeat-associated protein
VTNYVYDGLNPVQEKNGATVTANLLTGLGIDEFFTRTDGVGVRSLLPDALGSTVALGDGTGTLQTQYTYEPFGVTTQTGSASTSSYKYTGREDDGSGLIYYRARYYQPRLQRFIAEDPLGVLGGDANLYAYVWNVPIRYSDPSGQLGFTGGTAGAGVGAIIGGAIGILRASISDCSLLSGFAQGATVGAATGFLAGSGLGLVDVALGGGLASFDVSITAQNINNLASGANLNASSVISTAAKQGLLTTTVTAIGGGVGGLVRDVGASLGADVGAALGRLTSASISAQAAMVQGATQRLSSCGCR